MASNIFSMPSSSTLLLFSLAFRLTNARPWHGATKTAVYREDNWSPRPTQMAISARELFGRDHVDVAVCGWKGGNSASPVACDSGSSCVHDTKHGFVGCCATSGPCTAGVYTSCVDENSQSWGEDSGLVDTGIYTCPSGQYCNQNLYPGGYSQYSCGPSGQAATVETSFTGQPTDLSLQIVYTGVNFSPSTAAASTTSSSSYTSSSQTSSQTVSASFTTSFSSRTSATSKSSPTTSSKPNSVTAAVAATTTAAAHSNSSTKAIIGGVVGGLALLTAILGVILFFLQRRHAQRNQQRAGSFISGLKGGPPPTKGPFQRIAPYSPDDFQSSTTERERGTPSTIAAAFPNNHLTPPGPAATPFFPANSLSEDSRYGDEGPIVTSEIDDFARGFNEVAMHHQSPHLTYGEPYQGRGPEYEIETPGFEVPVSTPQHQASNSDLGPLCLIPGVGADIGATTAGLRRGGSGGSEREPRASDRLMGENKPETVGKPEASSSGGFAKAPVREEGWSPEHLKTSPPRERDVQVESVVQRYQLVDEAPTDGVQVLRTPGQLRGSRARRGRNST